MLMFTSPDGDSVRLKSAALKSNVPAILLINESPSSTVIIADAPPASEAHSQRLAPSFHLRSSLSAHPFRRVIPLAETSKPELDEIAPVFPEVVRLMSTVPEFSARPLPAKLV